jgi:hypothetical protein
MEERFIITGLEFVGADKKAVWFGPEFIFNLISGETV